MVSVRVFFMPCTTKTVLSVVSSPLLVESYCLVADAFIVNTWIVDISVVTTAGTDGLIVYGGARLVLGVRFIGCI